MNISFVMAQYLWILFDWFKPDVLASSLKWSLFDLQHGYWFFKFSKNAMLFFSFPGVRSFLSSASGSGVFMTSFGGLELSYFYCHIKESCKTHSSGWMVPSTTWTSSLYSSNMLICSWKRIILFKFGVSIGNMVRLYPLFGFWGQLGKKILNI